MEPILGSITIFAGNFAPQGWAFCDGQTVLIKDNMALFSILGTTYGGDGQQTFCLPDLRGRVPVHAGQGNGLSPRYLGDMMGSETVALNTTQIQAQTPSGDTAVAVNLGGQPYDNMQPSLCLQYIIATQGVYPMRP